MRAGMEENVIGRDTETGVKVSFWCAVKWASPHLARAASRGWRKGAVIIMKNKHQRSLTYVPGVMPCYLHMSFYLILTATISGKHHYFYHFIGEKFRLYYCYLFKTTATVRCEWCNQDSNTGPLDP